VGRFKSQRFLDYPQFTQPRSSIRRSASNLTGSQLRLSENMTSPSVGGLPMSRDKARQIAMKYGEAAELLGRSQY
jgi:hypothetical protein